MKNKSLRKSILRDLRHSPGRFIAVFIIIAIGSGFFAGIACTAPSMLLTADNYFNKTRLADIRLVSTMGITNEDVSEVRSLDEVEAVMPRYAFTAKVKFMDIVSTISVKSLPHLADPDNPNYLNQITLIEGEMPKAADECVIDVNYGAKIGSKFTITDEIEGGDIDMLAATELTVVGIAKSPEYITFARGNTTLGNGEINSFLYVPDSTFDSEYYTEINILLKESVDISAFSQKYKDLIEESEAFFDKLGEERAFIRHQDILDEAEEKIAEAQQELNDSIRELNEELADARAELDDGRAQYEQGRQEYLANSAKLADAEAKLAEAKKSLAAIPPGVPPEMLPVDPNVLAAQIAATEKQLASGRAALEEAYRELTNAREEISSGEQKYADGVAEANQKIADAQQEIDDARAEIADIDKPEWMTFTREDNPGYSTLEPNADRIGSLSLTIPPFMFLIAALVCLTTMTRLVEEQRTLIGTLKALGFSRRTIIAKYMFYSILVSLLGSILGVVLGIKLFPTSIWNAYGEMFTLGDFYIMPVPIVCIVALLAGVITTTLTTYSACYNVQKSQAAQLMRPKAPKPGKRVFLERIGIIWRRLSFHQKSTIRNMFRYKKRLFMTLIGVAGCCALLLGGIGLQDSVAGIADKQYSEISHYDILVLLDDDAENKDELTRELASKGDTLLISQSSGRLEFNGKNTSEFSLEFFIPSEPSRMSDFVSLIDYKTKEYFTLSNATSDRPGIVITTKIADILDVKKGDVVSLTNSNDEVAELEIAGITQNYIFNYIYMTPDDYERAFEDPLDFSSVLLTLYQTSNADEDAQNEKIDSALTSIIKMDGIEYAMSSKGIKRSVDEISDNMNTVMLIVRNMAALLALVVLYNLININITEREREIATLKVLGYKRSEVFMYIFSESMLLTLIGSAFGLFIGIGLHAYVISAIETDEVTFIETIEPSSFVLALVFTLLCCVAVNIIMQPKLRKIEPVSSLKSPE